MSRTTGRHFLQIPGPSNVPDEVLRAMSAPTIDHRGPTFAELGREVLAGLGPVFGTTNPVVRHQRHAEATRAAVRGWGLEILCADEREHSGVLTAILLPDGHDADEVRRIILDRYDMSLGAGLGKVAGKVFRIGHLGHFNDLTLPGTLAGVQMGLRLAGVPVDPEGVELALARLEQP